MEETINFKVGDIVYLDKQYRANKECENYSFELNLDTPYTVCYAGINNLGRGPTQCIKLSENPKYFQSAFKFKLWSTKDIKSTDNFFDAALKAAKKVWPEFEWGCKMANRAGQTFTAIKPEEFTELRKITWGKFITGNHHTCIIDPKNTYQLNYFPSDLTVVSTKSAKERAEELMSSLPKSAAVKDQDIPEDVKKKLAERDKKEEFESPNPDCQKYKVGDAVIYMGENCKIVNYDYLGSYILEYSKGWERGNTKLLLPGTLDPTKKYHFANDFSITEYANRGAAARIAEHLGNQELDYLKKPIKKDSSLIELKQEPHTITESLAEPMLLRYNKSKSKLISI